MRRLRILTWDSHPRYLRALQRAPHDFHVVGREGGARGIRRQRFDLVLFQDERQYLDEQYAVLSAAQRCLPSIYLEHEPPREHPVDSRHVACTPEVLVVHVSAFNRLMWDNGAAPTRVIEHGVVDPGYRYSGELARGLVAAGELERGRRRVGFDLYEQARSQVPLDLAGGMAPLASAARYRFLFHPARHGSLDPDLIEAMMAGLPVVALATGETASLVRDGENGFADTAPERLVARMAQLLRDREAAVRLGRQARRSALQRFGLARFLAEWNRAFADAAGLRAERAAA